ncbi:hypothetical protein T265_11176 [Opisthorchis viverrini]|uniref:Uncharacterized protein n=1 Tax=Opisthorchis viverrini TaxID=6198 RepID=A0A074Z3Z6_OPIVI|nr:hypothetical protein T265_11176 [Opisthorchis viverrini]KER20222.1 hypothetical protein T265_11176 [Opisthorchis viverrini]
MKVYGKLSPEFTTSSGVREGYPLSPFLPTHPPHAFSAPSLIPSVVWAHQLGLTTPSVLRWFRQQHLRASLDTRSIQLLLLFTIWSEQDNILLLLSQWTRLTLKCTGYQKREFTMQPVSELMALSISTRFRLRPSSEFEAVAAGCARVGPKSLEPGNNREGITRPKSRPFSIHRLLTLQPTVALTLRRKIIKS